MDLIRVQLHFEMLYSNDSFNFNELNAYFNDFSIIIFELQSSSINFTPILKKIKQYKKINEKIQLRVIFDEYKIKKISNNKDVIDMVDLKLTIKIINENDFIDFSSISKIVIPSSVTKICKRSFKGCKSLKKISIPPTVTSIEEESFSDCTSLTKFIIPANVTKIQDLTFENCTSLKEITIPLSVTSIGNNSFDGCSSLLKIDIPSSVTTIGKCAFSKCESLTHIFIPSSVNEIGEKAFEFCKSIKIIGISKILSIVDLGIPPNIMVINDDDFSEIL